MAYLELVHLKGIPCRSQNNGKVRALLPGNFQEKKTTTLRNVVSSIYGNQVSVSQARLELTQILFKKLNTSRKWTNSRGWEGGRMATTELLVVFHCEFIFYRISIKDIR